MSDQRVATPSEEEDHHDSSNGDAHKPQDSGGAINGAPQVDQIRELIFGQQMTDYEGRFAALEKKLNDEIDRLRGDVEKALEDLNRQTTDRTNQVEAESVPRKQIAESLENLAKTLRG